jgi:hypothetical protein
MQTEFSHLSISISPRGHQASCCSGLFGSGIGSISTNHAVANCVKVKNKIGRNVGWRKDFRQEKRKEQIIRSISKTITSLRLRDK